MAIYNPTDKPTVEAVLPSLEKDTVESSKKNNYYPLGRPEPDPDHGLTNRKSNNPFGRPKGSQNEETKVRNLAYRELRLRVAAMADKLLDRQLGLAMGVSYLYEVIKDEEGRKIKAEKVEDEETIRAYLEGRLEGDYYYITTEKPDLAAIKDMFDRAFGKAPQSFQLSNDPENPVTPILSGVTNITISSDGNKRVIDLDQDQD